jgi:hypothetical protein
MHKVIILILLLSHIKSDQIIGLRVSPNKDKEVNFLLSEIANQVNYIKLETNEKCMIARIKKLLFDKENVFIVTHQGAVSRLFLFTSDGKFVKEIGSQGIGPGEYSSVLDITLDKSKKMIYFLDTMGKVFKYDYSGKYLNTIKLDSRPESILFSNDALYLFTSWPDYYLNKGYGIQVKELSANKKDTYVLNRKYVKNPFGNKSIVYANYCYGINTDKSVYFLDAKFDTLYNIDSNYIINPTMSLSLEDKIPINLFTLDDYNNAIQKYSNYFRFIKTRNYIFFSVMTANPSTLYFYRLNLSSGELLKHNVTKDKSYVFNDIDGGLPFNPEGLADDGVLYSVLDCYKLKEHLSKGLYSKQKVLNPTQTNELKKTVQNSDYSDNPIIMRVTLK